jgi:DNA repair exonuclease SbcCD ATPase subunit
VAVAEHGTEGGFGTGLRAKLQSGDAETPPEPRSPAEAIAAAAPVVGETEAEALRAELNASLARAQQLRSSLNDQTDASGREVQFEQQLAEQSAGLDRRAAALAETQAELDERERRMTERLAELDGLLEAKEELTKLEARLAEREQLVELKVHELKVGDAERAAAAVEVEGKLAKIAKRENDLAKAEARVSAAGEETEGRQAKLMRALEEREEKARVKDEQARALEKRVAERAESLTATERELTQARVQLDAREKVLGKREAEIDSESVSTEERLVARARELDERELELSKKAGDVTARIEQL